MDWKSQQIDLLQMDQNPGKIFLVDINKIIPVFIWKGKGTRIAKTLLKKEKQGGKKQSTTSRLII